MTKTTHPDLEWLAKNVDEWAGDWKYISRTAFHTDAFYTDHLDRIGYNHFTRAQWQAAREDLGLVMTSDEEEITAEDYQRAQVHVGGSGPTLSDLYPDYFKDVTHLTEVDVYQVHRLFRIGDYSGAIHHASKKLLLSGQRTGGKSKADDIREARDTLSRWLAMEEGQ